MDPYTDSESDNDAPEEVSLSTARQSTKKAAHSRAEDEAKAKIAAREKNRQQDAKAKANKGKQRAEKAEAAKLAAELAAAEDDEEDDSDDQEEAVTAEPVASTSKHTHLDPDLFKSAAAFYEPAPQPAPGTSKAALKRAAKQAKREHRQMMEHRNAEVREGGQRTVGGTTIQHLPSTSAATASLASSSTAPATSASKFLNSRLYSQRRLVALASATAPKDPAPSARKRAKGPKKGGMSDESRRLLGLPVAGDQGNKNDDDDSEDEVIEGKRKKRAMLIKGEGRRTAVGLARPLASSRARGRPAANFAVASRKQ